MFSTLIFNIMQLLNSTKIIFCKLSLGKYILAQSTVIEIELVNTQLYAQQIFFWYVKTSY